MILRFSSGSVTPASASRNCFSASTTLRSTPVAATKSRSTCSVSPWRISPWSTYTQVSRSPIAFCTIAAATAESTPPERPQMAWPRSPIWARIFSICSSAMLDIVQVGRQPAMSSRKCSSTFWPCSVCSTSGCHWTPARLAVDVLERRHGSAVGRGEDGEALGRRGDRVAVGHPDVVLRRGCRRAGCRPRRPRPGCGRTRGRRCARPRRRGPGPSAGSRNTCRRPGSRT